MEETKNIRTIVIFKWKKLEALNVWEETNYEKQFIKKKLSRYSIVYILRKKNTCNYYNFKDHK